MNLWPWNKKAERKRKIEENARRAARSIAEAYRMREPVRRPRLVESEACDFLGCDDVWVAHLVAA